MKAYISASQVAARVSLGSNGNNTTAIFTDEWLITYS